MAYDMPEPCKLPSLGSCQKRFLWTHKEVDLAPHQVIGFVLQVGGVEKFPQALGFEGPDPFSKGSKQGPSFTATEEDDSDNRLVRLEFACEADDVGLPGSIYSGYR